MHLQPPLISLNRHRLLRPILYFYNLTFNNCCLQKVCYTLDCHTVTPQATQIGHEHCEKWQTKTNLLSLAKTKTAIRFQSEERNPTPPILDHRSKQTWNIAQLHRTVLLSPKPAITPLESKKKEASVQQLLAILLPSTNSHLHTHTFSKLSSRTQIEPSTARKADTNKGNTEPQPIRSISNICSPRSNASLLPRPDLQSGLEHRLNHWYRHKHPIYNFSHLGFLAWHYDFSSSLLSTAVAGKHRKHSERCGGEKREMHLRVENRQRRQGIECCTSENQYLHSRKPQLKPYHKDGPYISAEEAVAIYTATCTGSRVATLRLCLSRE